MKKGVILLLVSFILAIFILNLVTAATEYKFLFSGSKTSFEQIKTNFPIENPFLRYSAAVLGVYIFWDV